MEDTALTGHIKGISTKTKVDEDTGAVEHVTTLKVVFRDLDPETLDSLAIGEFQMRPLGFKLV
jgi:hypothetical protein